MAGLDYDLESVIIDLSSTSLDELSALTDEVITAVLRCGSNVHDSSSRLWSNDDLVPPETYRQ